MLRSPANNPAHVFARRMLYPSPLMTAPSVMLIDVPPRHRGVSLPLGRYYPIIIETEEERDELEVLLDHGRENRPPPDLLDQRPSNLWSDRILISRYDPPAAGWPWMSVTRWPDSFRDAAASHGLAMARECYTMELFGTSVELDVHCAALLEGLASHYPISVRMLSADSISSTGTA